MQFYTSLGLNTESGSVSSAMDYSYLLGRRGQSERHNPHVAVQERGKGTDLHEVSRLMRQPAAEVAETEKAE